MPLIDKHKNVALLKSQLLSAFSAYVPHTLYYPLEPFPGCESILDHQVFEYYLRHDVYHVTATTRTGKLNLTLLSTYHP